ncbi:MAG TPA: phenylacetate--CoA ligase, partial [Treponemataceae bacterium]|nr:phenylacetate--CoA ligase [Treponemataceae bacterium]
MTREEHAAREIPFRDKMIETAPRAVIEWMQLEGLKKQIAHALKTPFYSARYAAAGVTGPDFIKTLADIRKLPFTTKNDLRDAYPFGLLAVPKDQVVRVHASSGTTGTPTVIYLTQRDLDLASDTMARSLMAAGGTKDDIVQNMMTYGLFTGGLGFHYGAELMGAMVIPTSSGNTLRQLKFMKDFGTTMIHATPS